MTEPHDPNETLDAAAGRPGTGATPDATVDHGPLPADSLETGLAAGFGRNSGPPRSNLGGLRPVLLKEAEGDTALVVKPNSDAMPAKAEAGDRYRLDGEIARGGMGAVLRGRDVDLGRDLAVKVLLEKFANRPDVARRFIEEAQIGGQLQHPGVVPIYDIGTFGDRPFFAMKLVKGQTLAAILGERAEATEDRPRLLGIALQVSQAMAYAHAKGVIHRDLKPANIMVGAFGEVQVMDWGLAKVLAEGGAHDEERASRAHRAPEETTIRTARSTGSHGSFGTDTEVGSILGTPAYMPPEQARGETDRIDEHADVFAMGSILCEILTGSPAFTGRSSTEILHKAAAGDTADALARLDGCGAESDLIALAKDCLAVEPEDRPHDANVVSERITAYLAGVQERVQAAERERAVAVARAIEERRRRKVQLALAASVLALTTLGGLSTTYYLQQRSARAAAGQRVVEQVTTLRGQALAHPEDIQRWQVALAAVEQADPAGDPKTRVQLVALRREIQAGLDAVRRDKALLDRLVDIRSAMADDHNDSAATDADYADAFRAAGLDLEVVPPDELGEQIRIRPATVSVAMAAGLDAWATLRRRQRGDLAGAALLSAVARVADPDTWRNEFRIALERDNEETRHAKLHSLVESARLEDLDALSLDLMGTELAATNPTEAETVLRWAQRRYPGDVWVNYHLATVLEARSRPNDAIRFYMAARALRPETAHQLAHVLDEQGESDEAIAIFRELAHLRPLEGRHLGCLGTTLKALGRSQEANEALDAAVVACGEAIRLDPDNATARGSLGRALATQRKFEEAVAQYREQVRLMPKFAGPHHNLGAALKELGRLDEAVAAYGEAVRLDPNASSNHSSLGIALAAQGKFEEAIAEYHEAIRLKPNNPVPQVNLGNALRTQGKLDEAADAFREAIRIKPNHASAHNGLGLVLRDWRKFDEAVAEYQEAIRNEPGLAVAHYNLGNVLKAQGKLDEAVAEYREAVRLDPSDPLAHSNLGTGLRTQGNLDEAIAEYHEAIRLNPQDATFHNNLGNALTDLGKLAEAAAALQEAIRVNPRLAVLHSNLANTLLELGNIDEAILACREAIRLQPKLDVAHAVLGKALRSQGRHDEALASYRHALGLGRPDSPVAREASAQIQQLEKEIRAVAHLKIVLKGEAQPKDAAEGIELAQLAHQQGLYAAAARLFAVALTADPELGDDRQAQHRYNAACTAAMGGTGQGKDDPPPDDAAKTKLRKQARDWLQAEIVAWSKLLESGPPQARPTIVKTLTHWQKDTDLVSIRDAEALTQLPEAERKEWLGLWADVAEQLRKAEAK